MSVPLLVCCMRSVCVVCAQRWMRWRQSARERERHVKKQMYTWITTISSWLVGTQTHFRSSNERAGSHGTGHCDQKATVLITLMKNTWYVFILYWNSEAIFQFYTSTNEQNTLRIDTLEWEQQKDAWHAEHCAECLSESFSIAMFATVTVSTGLFMCFEWYTQRDEWVESGMSALFSTQIHFEFLLEWNFPNALCDMTCVIARRNIRRHFLPSRFEMIKSIIWQLQIEFYMLNKLTYWRVTIYQPFIILMNSLENHVHLIDKCMPVWRVFEIHKNADFTWKWAVGRLCTACFSKE